MRAGIGWDVIDLSGLGYSAATHTNVQSKLLAWLSSLCYPCIEKVLLVLHGYKHSHQFAH